MLPGPSWGCSRPWHGTWPCPRAAVRGSRGRAALTAPWPVCQAASAPRSARQALGRDPEERGAQLGGVSHGVPVLCLRGLGRCAESQRITQALVRVSRPPLGTVQRFKAKAV